MATAIKNPNNFSPQFLADMKKGNPELYKSYTSGGSLSLKVALTITPTGGAVWTVTKPGKDFAGNNLPNNGGTSWTSFPSSQNKGLGLTLSQNGPMPGDSPKIYDQFGKTNWVPESGKTWQLPGGSGNFVSSGGTGIIKDEWGEPTSFQVRFASADTGNAQTGYMPYVADPSVTSLKQLQALQSAIGQSNGNEHGFDNADLDNILNYGSNGFMGYSNGKATYAPTYTVDAQTGAVTYAKYGQNPVTINTDYTKYKYDNNGNLKGFAQQPSPPPTTVPKTPTTTVPKPPVTPTTVPKPPVTPTTVPKPPVTPTTVPKPPVTPTTVPKPPVTPTTTPAPHPTTTTPAPHPTTTTPVPHPVTPTTVPHPTTTTPAPHPTTTTPAPHPTTTTPPNSGFPTLPSFPSASGTNTTIKWPSEQYMIAHGVSPTLAKTYGGKIVDTTGYSSNNEGAVKAMVDALGTAQSRNLFSDWVAQGFDPAGFRDASKASAFARNVKSFMPSVVAQGWDKTKASDWTFTNGGVTHKTATVSAPGGGGGTTNVNIDSTKQVTAYSTLQNELSAWGLDSLTGKVFNKVFKEGISDPTTLTNFVRSTPEYKQSFQGLAEYNATNPQKLTEQQYTQLSQAYMNTAQQYGLPDSFFTKQEVGNLIANGVSAAEFNRRIANGYQTALNADPATRQALAAQGVDFGHLLAYYLDPKKAEPILTNKTNQAQLQGYAQNAGIADFTSTMAGELAQHARNSMNPDGTFSTANEKQALDLAASGQGLTAAAPGSNAQTVDTTQLIGSKLAGFGGTTQTDAQQAVQQASQQAQAPFNKAGGYTSTTQGVTGAGSAPQ